jgi:glutamyl-tRNA synthetase
LERPVVVGRLAPSPTGVLHVGNARSLLWAWLSARARGGRVLLRVEDLLPGSPEHVASVVRDLVWPGIEAALRAPHAEDRGPRYPGTCRGRFVDLASALRWEAARASRLGHVAVGAAQRLRAPRGVVSFDDALCGRTLADVAGSSGDFVVRRKDGSAAYVLAVVVDDVAMGVDDVVRGDDLLEVTGEQIVVYDALAEHAADLDFGSPARRLSRPRWTHVPLVYGDDDRRLAKRNRSLHVATLQARGVSPALLRRWLAASMGLPAIADGDALAAAYADVADAGALRRGPVRFGQRELDALSAGELPPVRAIA